MSLATSGGIGGGMGGAAGAAGGLTMAHQANAVGRVQPAPQATTGAPAPPPSAAVLGVDLIDKTQGLSLKNVKNVSHLPIVAIDLHGIEQAQVAYFPKKPEDPSKGALPVAVAKMKTDVALQSGETAHKTFRKFLAKSKNFVSLKAESLTQSNNGAIVLHKPHYWLGLRRIDDATESLRSTMTCEESTGPAIAEELPNGVGVVVANSSLDGSTRFDNDYDRVVFKVRLSESKKAISVLPDEAVEILLREAQHLTAAKLKVDLEDQEIVEYPCAVALPAWACHDAAVEALMDALGSGGVVVQRNVAALAGALLPSVDGQVTPLLERMNAVRTALQMQHQKRLIIDPGAVFEDDLTILVFGMTEQGCEATAIQVSAANVNNISCLFSVFRVLSNVSYMSKDPISRMEACAKDLEQAIETVAPEADGPTAIVFCGSKAEQQKMAAQWDKVKNQEWENVPVFQTAPGAIAKGTAVLGAVSHGRLSKLVQTPGKKARVELGLRVQNVAPVAVAVQMNYFGGDADKWTPIKTIFDFDRQIPAGPHVFDLTAAECAVYRNDKAVDDMSEEDFLKAVKQYEGAKGIPKREEAALNFSIQVLQKWTRDEEWKKVGDPIEPLVKLVHSDTGVVPKRIACESVALELSLGVTGMVSTGLVGELESVIVANKSARNSAIRYYFGIVFAILFFGYFMFKSYYDDYVLERDTRRLLAFYKHVVSGSFHDGDVHNARYTCYKYRNKKDKLWRNLEKKYGVPVLPTQEYLEIFAQQEAEETKEAESETVDLDDEQEDKKEEPDL